jgi:hypothetical protein
MLGAAAALSLLLCASGQALRPPPGDTTDFLGGARVIVPPGMHPHLTPGGVVRRVAPSPYLRDATIDVLRFFRWTFGDPCPADLPGEACRFRLNPIWIVQFHGAIRLCPGLGPCVTVATAYFLVDDRTGWVGEFGTPASGP